MMRMFKHAIKYWVKVVDETLELSDLFRSQQQEDDGERTKQEVIVRAYVGGHEHCHESAGPVEEVVEYVEKLFNWPSIYQFNDGASHLFLSLSALSAAS